MQHPLEVEHIPKKNKKIISNENIKANIYKIQPNGSLICGYFCVGFIAFMLKFVRLYQFIFSKRV